MSDRYEDFTRGDVVYMHVGPESDKSPRYIGVVTGGKHYGVKIKWYDVLLSSWIGGVMSHTPDVIRFIGKLPEWAEWDVRERA